MKKFLIILYIIIFAGLAYYVITLFVNRDFQNKDADQKESAPKIINTSNSDDSDKNNTTSSSNNQNLDTINNTEENEIYNTESKNSKYHITRENCDTNCNTITDKDELDYCLEICGLASEKIVTDSCDNLNGLEKDYCIRNKAIEKNNASLCDEIQDGGITKQCYNRINEDFIDEVM